jgi:hypothetical protein
MELIILEQMSLNVGSLDYAILNLDYGFLVLRCVWERVTRLGEFSPIGRLFTLVLKIIELAQNFGYLLSRYQLCIIFATKMVGQHFGDFFQKLIWSP